MAALTIEQVAEAFELVDKGVYRENIASVMGVSTTCLNRYLRNARRYGYSYWAHDRYDESSIISDLEEEVLFLRAEVERLGRIINIMSKDNETATKTD